MNRSIAALAGGAACGLACGPACAQPGFVEGDVYLVSPALADGPFSLPGVMHIDPATWTGTVLAFALSQFLVGRAAYDPSRDRLVVVEGGSILLLAADGAATPLVDGQTSPTNPSPTGDGRIYFNRNGHFFAYVDAAGVVHTVLNQAGDAPLQLFNLTAMTWDEGTNALFVVDSFTSPGLLTISRVTLTPDGSRALAVASVTADVSATQEVGTGFSRGPGGSLLLGVDTNSNEQEPRLLLVDPQTLSVTTFASPGYPFVAGMVAGAYIPHLSSAIVLDTGNDVVRLFGQGSAGEGTILPTADVSSIGGSGEMAQFVVIARACPGGADLAPPYGVLDFSDILAFLSAFGAMDPAADLAAPPGVWDFSDVLAFLNAYGAGCP